MKCLLLAGGRGDRLWPLSRKNYPKQFIQIKNNHSIFQETIARNMAFCDEFIIVTNKEYEFIIEDQMKAFQGLTYRCVFEEVGRKTTAAIVLAALQFPMSEIIFVAASDHLIEGESYPDDILRAKELAKEGSLVTFGIPIKQPDTRFGYIHYQGDKVLEFTEKPEEEVARRYYSCGDYYINSGMFVFQNGTFLAELRSLSPYLSSMFESAFYMKHAEGNKVFYAKSVMEDIPSLPIEKAVFEKTRKGKVVPAHFAWKDIGSLEDLSAMDLVYPGNNSVIMNQCEDTTILNKCDDRIVVANQLSDMVIINTEDALYIGKKGASDDLKNIIREQTKYKEYFDKSRIFYRNWGNYEILMESPKDSYQIRRVTVLPGKTIYLHMHEKRTEHWCIVSGNGIAFINGEEQMIGVDSVINIAAGTTHQISNSSDQVLIFIETATGIIYKQEDMVRIQSRDLSEAQLGYEIDPFVLLKPAFKDYLWGGTRLRQIYDKQCEYDTIAESWELSAHTSGQSIVDSGKYKGMLFSEYLKRIGRESLGWKFQTMKEFPLMIKLIDARDDLSIQVHPGDDYALEHEHEYGKSEMWYIIDCDPDSCIYCGFKQQVSREDVLKGIKDGTLLGLLNRIQVEKGKTYYIPSGTVHAIGKGCLICEIQQNSNSTYRIYDYDRVDRFGQKRRLDVDKALNVLNMKPYKCFEVQEDTDRYQMGETISSCKYFECVHFNCEDNLEVALTEDSFMALMMIEGDGVLRIRDQEADIPKGKCVFIPKQNGKLQVSGKCEFIIAHI